MDDHIGAVAVLAGRWLFAGASWDTETVYLWGFLRRRETGLTRGSPLPVGTGAGDPGRSGLRVQDWKGTTDALVASGLFSTGGVSSPSVSRVLILGDSLSSPPVLLPPSRRLPGGALAQEAMCVHDGCLWFPSRDLETNRLIRLPMPESAVRSWAGRGL